MRRRRLRSVVAALSLGVLLVLLGHPLASAASDIWGNVGPASQLGSNGLFGRYPLSHYTLDQHFDAVSASLTGGVDVSGVPPMIAYFLASILWVLTSFLANLLISLFSFAFSLDLVNGSQATGGVGALAPVSQAIHSIYANVFGGPWLVLAIAVVGVWAMWKALVQRRYSETAGALGLSLIYVVLALFFVAQPAATIGSASKWTNQMSESFLSISDHGSLSGGRQAKDDAANQLFDLLVFKPWVVLNFGGLEHCALAGSGSSDSDPESAPVRPLSSNPSRDAALARRLASGTEVSADGKVCVNNANKYASHFLRFGLDTDERSAEYDALNDGDSSKLPDADTAKAGYKLGVADKPATDAMEAGGQYQRLLVAIVVFGRRARRLLPARLALDRDHPRAGPASAPAGLRAGGAGRGGDPRPRPRLLQGLAGEARRLPAAQGRLLADPGDPAGGQRRPGQRHLRARLADVLRLAGALLLGCLPAAEDPRRQPDRDRDGSAGAGARRLAARAGALRGRPRCRADVAPDPARGQVGDEGTWPAARRRPRFGRRQPAERRGSLSTALRNESQRGARRGVGPRRRRRRSSARSRGSPRPRPASGTALGRHPPPPGRRAKLAPAPRPGRSRPKARSAGRD